VEGDTPGTIFDKIASARKRKRYRGVSMNQFQLSEVLEGIGAIITGSHIVYNAGDHGPAYINKDAIYTNPCKVRDICGEFVPHIQQYILERQIRRVAIVSPAVGGVALSQWTTYLLQQAGVQAIALYADKNGDKFVLKRGYEKLVKDVPVIVVEDILNSGGTAMKTVSAVREAGGIVDLVLAIVNRGKVTGEMLGVSHARALLSLDMVKYLADQCPLCEAGVPINTSVGHGKEFLARKSQAGASA
jgi:orotate phosphoribosyltransferase